MKHLERNHMDLEEELSKSGAPGTPPPDVSKIPPELKAEIERKFKEEHYATWPDVPIPALDGITPREAARLGGEPKRELELLLRDLEYREGRLPEDCAFDVSRLRAELGMPS